MKTIEEFVTKINNELKKLGIENGLKVYNSEMFNIVINNELMFLKADEPSWKKHNLKRAIRSIIEKHYQKEYRDNLILDIFDDAVHSMKYQISELLFHINLDDINLYEPVHFFKSTQKLIKASEKMKEILDNPENKTIIMYGEVMDKIKNEVDIFIDEVNTK